MKYVHSDEAKAKMRAAWEKRKKNKPVPEKGPDKRTQWGVEHRINLHIAKQLKLDHPDIYAYLEGKVKALLEFEFKNRTGI